MEEKFPNFHRWNILEVIPPVIGTNGKLSFQAFHPSFGLAVSRRAAKPGTAALPSLNQRGGNFIFPPRLQHQLFWQQLTAHVSPFLGWKNYLNLETKELIFKDLTPVSPSMFLSRGVASLVKKKTSLSITPAFASGKNTPQLGFWSKNINPTRDD